MIRFPEDSPAGPTPGRGEAAPEPTPGGGAAAPGSILPPAARGLSTSLSAPPGGDGADRTRGRDPGMAAGKQPAGGLPAPGPAGDGRHGASPAGTTLAAFIRCPVCKVTVPCDSPAAADKRADRHVKLTGHPTAAVTEAAALGHNTRGLRREVVENV